MFPKHKIALFFCFYSIFSLNQAANTELTLKSCVRITTENLSEQINNNTKGMLKLIEFGFQTKPTSNNVHSIRFIVYKNDQFFYMSQSNATQMLDTSQETKILIHGWQANYTLEPYIELIDAYRQRNSSHNFIFVDWSPIAYQSYLKGCLASSAKTGNYIGEFIANLAENSTSFVDNIDLFGHSCGAHIAGHVGATILRKTGRKVGRIVGLDSSGPGFEFPSFFRTLQKADAQYVVGWFTNPGFYGRVSTYGHVNVRFNNVCQPQCVHYANFMKTALCSHVAAVYYWIESMHDPYKYMAFPCSDNFLNCSFTEQVPIGDLASYRIEGNYYTNVTTSKIMPDFLF